MENLQHKILYHLLKKNKYETILGEILGHQC